MRQTIGRVLVILALALLFFAYSNFLPTSLSNDLIADYVKNHFIREVIFGTVLAALAIRLSYRMQSTREWIALGVMGSIVVLPFWIGMLLGWSTGGLTEIWGGAIDENGAYYLHGPQVVGFYVGWLLMYPASSKRAETSEA